jgi:hypothetical protein
MNKNKPIEAELMPSADMILRSGIDEKTLNLLVQTKVAEIMAERDAIVFEPFFRSRQIAYELKRLQTVPEQMKWRTFFERYGCLLCETRKRIHVGNGMCARCYQNTFNTLKQIIREGIAGETARPSSRASRALLMDSPQAPGLVKMNGGGLHRRWNKRRTRKSKGVGR